MLLEAMMDFKRRSSVEIMRLYLNGELDTVLDKYFQDLTPNPQGLTLQLMKRYGVDNPEAFLKDLHWFTSLYNSAIFKRVQSVPIIVTSKNSFGYDNRETMSPLYVPKEVQKLKEKILKLTQYTPREAKA